MSLSFARYPQTARRQTAANEPPTNHPQPPTPQSSGSSGSSQDSDPGSSRDSWHGSTQSPKPRDPRFQDWLKTLPPINQLPTQDTARIGLQAPQPAHEPSQRPGTNNPKFLAWRNTVCKTDWSPVNQPPPIPISPPPSLPAPTKNPHYLAWRSTVCKIEPYRPKQQPQPRTTQPPTRQPTHIYFTFPSPPPSPSSTPSKPKPKPTPFPLLSLPLEIRLQIYAHALGGNHIHIQRSRLRCERNSVRCHYHQAFTPFRHRICKPDTSSPPTSLDPRSSNFPWPANSSSSPNPGWPSDPPSPPPSSSFSPTDHTRTPNCQPRKPHPRAQPKKLDLRLLRACQQLHSEARPTVYSANTFSIPTRAIPDFVSAVGLPACARIRGLHLSGYVDSKLESRDFRAGCTSVVRAFTGLREVRVSVELGAGAGLSGRSSGLSEGVAVRKGRAWLVGVVGLRGLEGLRGVEVEFLEKGQGEGVRTEGLERLEGRVKALVMSRLYG